MKLWIRRLLFSGAILLVLSIVACVGGGLLLSESYPSGGSSGTKADDVAISMMKATNTDAWDKTGAVTWTFGGRSNHLWDRTRNLVRVRKGDVVAWIDIASHRGLATKDGVALTGPERDEAVDEGWAAWANDSFWLNAPNKVFDQGTTRTLHPHEGGQDKLVISYTSGGVTPGDTYMWHVDPRGRPTSWQMWVSIIPIKGISASWEGWVQLSTGAWISTKHSIGPVDIDITDLKGAATLAELEPGPDPFAPLLKSLAP